MQVYSSADYPQLGDRWWELRAGTPSASCAKRIITAATARGSSGMDAYAAELCADLQCSSPAYFTNKQRPINRHTDYGRNLEEESRNWFAFSTGMTVKTVGMIKTDDLRFGASPDGLIEEDGKWIAGLEIKNVEAHKHAAFLLKGVLPNDFKAQVHFSLAVSGLPFWYFLSYHPDMEKLVIKVPPDDFTKAMRVQMEVFWERYQEIKKKLGVGQMPEPTQDPAGAQALADWKEFIASRPALASLNGELPKLSKAGTGKPASWAAIKAYAASQKWVFDGKALVFKEEEASVNF